MTEHGNTDGEERVTGHGEVVNVEAVVGERKVKEEIDVPRQFVFRNPVPSDRCREATCTKYQWLADVEECAKVENKFQGSVE